MTFIAIIKIIRPINLVITFFSVIIAAVISSSLSQLSLNVFLIALSVSFSCAAGNVINDVIDFEIDKINRPERILPKGLLSISFAKSFYVVLVLFSLLLAAIVSVETLVLLIAINLLLLVYSTHFKNLVLLSNFIAALATSSALILGGVVVHNIEGSLIPAGFAFFTNFIREIIKDVEDIKGDSAEGVKTFPQLVGIKKAVRFIIGLIILLMILDTLPFLLSLYNVEYFVLIMIFVNPVFVYTIKLLNGNSDLVTIKKVSSLVKLNMILGLIAILIGAQ